MKLLQKGVRHVGVGTPGRISALIERGTCGREFISLLRCPRFSHSNIVSTEGLTLQALRYLVLDWNWRDQKLRRMVDIPEVSSCPLLEEETASTCN